MIVVDCHSDYGIRVMHEHLRGKDQVLKEQHLPDLKIGGVNVECLVVGGDFDFYPQINSRNHEIIFKTIEIINAEIQSNPEIFLQVKQKKDLEKLSNKTGFLLTLEGAGSIGSDVTMINEFYKIGVRLITLTHNERNEIGDGIGVINPKGLSNFGKDAINRMNDLGIIIDLSHSSEPLFWDVINKMEVPCIASHSNAKSICNQVRNLNDNQLLALGEIGGVIGMNMYGGFIDLKPEQVTIDRLIDHVDHIVDLIGIDHVGIGADFLDYVVKDGIQLIDTSSEESKKSPVQIQYPRILANVSQFSQIFEHLEKRGYNKREIRKIGGENFVRVFKSILK